MSFKKLVVIFSSILLLAVTSSVAWAADVQMSLTGTPTSAMQGETKGFTINISATGNINLDQIPAYVHVDTAYVPVTLLVSNHSTTDSTSGFSAPATTGEGCVIFTNGANTGQCKPSQNVTGGPYAIAASVSVPAALAPGTYLITIYATVDSGLGLPTTMPSFYLEVTAASSAPSVSIINPANGSSDFLVNQPTDAAVQITSALPLDSVTAALNGNAITLTFDSESGNYVGSMTLTQPGSNTFYVQACNSVGCGDDTSVFTVHYNFGSWLPPITTAKFQSGRTLPVKFRIADYNGPTENAVATVKLDNVVVGTAAVTYDSTGAPYYQLNVVLDVSTGPHSISVSLDDSFTNVTYPITVK